MTNSLPLDAKTPSPPSANSSILPVHKSSNPSAPTSLRRQGLSSQISLAHTAHVLTVCCLITGLLDSTLFYAYGTFVSGQTGNTILFGLGASTSHVTTKPYRWAKSLVAIISFVWGCAFFSHATRILGNLKRGVLILSFVLQASIVFIVAGVIQGATVEGRLHKLSDEMDWRQCLPIALLSFQSAGQIVTSRALRIPEIPTVVLTSMIHDFATDPILLAPWSKNPKRNYRLAAFAATLVGAVAGGFVSIKTGKMQSTLWVVGALKLGIAGAWVVWPAEEVDSTDISRD